MSDGKSRLVIEQMFELGAVRLGCPAKDLPARPWPAQRRDAEMSAVADHVCGGGLAGADVAADVVTGVVGLKPVAWGMVSRGEPMAALVMQSTPVESGVRHVVFEQARSAPVLAPAFNAVPATARPCARRRKTQVGPEARPSQLRAPGGRPAQPTPPLVRSTVLLARSSVAAATTQRVHRRSGADEWELGSRGLATVMVFFLLTVVCGLVVAVNAFLDISAAPSPMEVAGPVSVVAQSVV